MHQDNIDESIDRFIRGEMNIEEERSFKNKLKSNSAFIESARAIALLAKGLNKVGKEKDEKIIEEIIAGTTHTHRILYWVCSTAAVIVIFIGYFGYTDYRHDILSDAVSSYCMPYDANSISRGETDSVISNKLVSLFNEIAKYNDTKNAIKELEPIYKSIDTNYDYRPFANDISWYLAIAYIKDDRVDQARKILEKLNSDNINTPIAIKVTKLLKKIKNL